LLSGTGRQKKEFESSGVKMIAEKLTIKRIDGIGVKHLTLISEMAAGRWPFLAPTKNSLELAKIAPFSDPKVEQATNKGISQANIPSILSPKVTATAREA
jgi:hypothetical protein